MTKTFTTIFRRFLAFAVDLLILAAWGGVIFAIVMLAADGEPRRPSGPWLAQAIGFVAMTLPFTLYFTVCECSPRHASVGKRVFALAVLRRSAEPMSFARTFLRNAIKFTPWECGHALAQQAIYAGDEGMPLWVWGPAVIAAIGPLWWIVSLLASGDTPYDRWVDARVSRSLPTSAPSGPPG